MLIKEIELHNIRSYKDEKISFQPGSTILSGDIGSGKSSILLAIEFGLFGTKKGELPSSLLLRHGENEGYVRLSFLLENKEYAIMRTLKRTKNGIKQDKGYIEVDGAKTYLMPEEIKARVIDLLGYPKEEIKRTKDSIFRFTIYTPQELMKQILYENNEDRKNTLRKIFGIDKYKVMRENIELYVKYLRSKIRAEIETVKDIDEYKSKREELKERRKGINIEEARRKESELKKIFDDVRDKKENMERKVKEYYENLSRKKIIEEKRANIEKNLAESSREFDEIKVKLEETIKEIDSIKVKDINKDEIIRERDRILKEINEKKRIEKEIPKLIEEKEKLKRELDEKIEKIDLNSLKKLLENNENIKKTLVEKKIFLNKRIKDNNQLKSNVENVSICPTCRQEITDEYKVGIINRCRDENEEILKEIEIIEGKLKKIEDAIGKTKTEIENAIKTNEKYELFMKKKPEMEERIRDIERKIKEFSEFKVNGNLDEIEKRIKEAEENDILKEKRALLVKQRDEMQERKEKILAKMKDLEDELREIKSIKIVVDENVKKEYEVIMKKFSEVNENYRNVSVELAKKEKELEGINNEIDMINSIIREKEEKKKYIKEIKDRKDWLVDFLSPLTMTIEKHVMNRIYIEFSELLQEWFSILIEDENMTVSLDDDFTPVIIQNGYETGINNLSGGERQALALAYRLALNKVINDLIQGIKTKDMLILDEPTDGFSSHQMDKIREVLERINVSQIIIVSHEQKLESYVDNLMRVVKEGHITRVIP